MTWAEPRLPEPSRSRIIMRSQAHEHVAPRKCKYGLADNRPGSCRPNHTMGNKTHVCLGRPTWRSDGGGAEESSCNQRVLDDQSSSACSCAICATPIHPPTQNKRSSSCALLDSFDWACRCPGRWAGTARPQQRPVPPRSTVMPPGAVQPQTKTNVRTD